MSKFLFGAATAAHQVEGNNIHSDYWKMENAKHTDYAEPSGIACDHYNRYEEDISLLESVGLNAYRFSVEWARIEPEEGKFVPEELEHYRRVLECCERHHITPIVTLMHFSSPAWLIGKGGWCDRRVVSYFERYAGYIAQNLGSQMPYVCTINEANMGFQLKKVAADMMSSSKKKPKEGDVQVGVTIDLKKIIFAMFEQGKMFHCSPFKVNSYLKPRSIEQEKIVMECHQAAKRMFKELCPETKIGLSLSLFDYQPQPGGEMNADKLWQEDFGMYLPYIKDDDFLGVQNYSRKLVGADGAIAPPKDAPVTQMGYEDYPASIGHILQKVAREFPGKLLVTENGISTSDDKRRCEFIKEAVASVMAAKSAGVPVIGYLYWSLLDNFEWQAGYAKTFGLIAVDRQTQKRSPKESLKVLGQLANKPEE